MFATDGEVGKVANALFDDERWALRYLVVETGSFFAERQVLISPVSFGAVDWSSRRFHLALTRDKVKSSPAVDVDQPVSRRREREYHAYYGYPYYWGMPGLWGMGGFPGALAGGAIDVPRPGPDEADGDVHLRSASAVRGYHVQGRDGEVGHVEDFIVDDESWQVRYLGINTSNWWLGKKVLVAPSWVTRVSWDDRKVDVDLPREAIKGSPEWDPAAPVSREYEARLYGSHGLPVYWGV